ncbi:MAG: hypothetical protein AB1814_18375 [Thermodesulfobacteriota bacterium]
MKSTPDEKPRPTPLMILRPGARPPCLEPGGIICRGCPGWAAMRRACGPDGPWQEALIHCPVTGLTARLRQPPASCVAGFARTSM